MKITVSGKNIDIGDSLRSFINENITKLSGLHLANAILSANVVVSKDKKKGQYNVDIFVDINDHSKVSMRGSSTDSDPYAAVSAAIERIIRQLVKHKERIISHRKNHHHDRLSVAIKEYTIGVVSEIAGDRDTIIEDDVAAAAAGEIGDNGEAAPVIISEENIQMSRLTLKDAVMRMDLLGVPAMVFINKRNSHISMIYYRQDGNIAWIDTQTVIEDHEQSET